MCLRASVESRSRQAQAAQDEHKDISYWYATASDGLCEGETARSGTSTEGCQTPAYTPPEGVRGRANVHVEVRLLLRKHVSKAACQMQITRRTMAYERILDEVSQRCERMRVYMMRHLPNSFGYRLSVRPTIWSIQGNSGAGCDIAA
jgi:hypothetical protein